MGKWKVRTWYLILIGLWAVLIAPGWIFGLLYAGGDLSYAYHAGDWAAALIDGLFVLPLLLLPFGVGRRTAG